MALINPQLLAQLQAGNGSGPIVLPGVSATGTTPTSLLGTGGYPVATVGAGGTTPASLIGSPFNTDIYARTRAATSAAQPVAEGIPVASYVPPSTGPASIPANLQNFADASGSGLLGDAAGVAPVVASAVAPAATTAVEDAAPGLLSRLAAAGPQGALSELTGGAGALSTLKTVGGGALEGLKGAAIPTIVGQLAGHAIGGKTGQVVSDASTGFGLGSGLVGAASSLLPEELAAGPWGWAAAAATAGLGGLYGLLHNDGGSNSNAHAAYQSGWKSIDKYADDLGILNGNVISGAKDAYNLALQSSKDPTDKNTQKTALASVQQALQQYQVQSAASDQQNQNLLSAQAFGQQALAPYLTADDQTSAAAQAAYGQLAAAAPNPQAAALANATGAGFVANNTANKAAFASQVQAAPLEYQQQQSLINQYQQQIAAAALAKGQTPAGV